MSTGHADPRLLGVRVLLAEDNDDARDLLEHVLRSRGAEVFSATNGAEAIPILLRERPQAVLTDLSMPFTDGHEVLKATREILGAVPCIALTAFVSEADRRAALAAGFDRYLPKPVDYLGLVDLLVEMLKPEASRISGVRERRGVASDPAKRRRKAK